MIQQLLVQGPGNVDRRERTISLGESSWEQHKKVFGIESQPAQHPEALIKGRGDKHNKTRNAISISKVCCWVLDLAGITHVEGIKCDRLITGIYHHEDQFKWAIKSIKVITGWELRARNDSKAAKYWLVNLQACRDGGKAYHAKHRLEAGYSAKQ